MLSCTSDRKPCCGPNSAVTSTPVIGEREIDDVLQLMIDRCGIADEADALAGETT